MINFLKNNWLWLIALAILATLLFAEKNGRREDNEKNQKIINSVKAELQKQKEVYYLEADSMSKEIKFNKNSIDSLLEENTSISEKLNSIKDERNQNSINLDSYDEYELDSILTNYRNK